MPVPFSLQVTLAVAVGFFGWVGVAKSGITLADVKDVVAGTGLTGCAIKGNISFETGERIYHLPGQMFYDETDIDLLSGERFFCSEAEARSAGWRKSRR